MDNLLIKQQEKYDKIGSLEGLIKSNSDPRELKRALAVKMSKLARRLCGRRIFRSHSSTIIVSVHGVPMVFLRSLGTITSGWSLKIPVDRNPKLVFRSNYVLL